MEKSNTVKIAIGKELLRMSDDLMYSSVNGCKCITKITKSMPISICQNTNTIIFLCENCTLIGKKLVKHLYVYPNKSDHDSKPFFACPIRDSSIQFPKENRIIHCHICNSINEMIGNVGFEWVCNNCVTGHLFIAKSDISFNVNENILKQHIQSRINW